MVYCAKKFNNNIMQATEGTSCKYELTFVNTMIMFRI